MFKSYLFIMLLSCLHISLMAQQQMGMFMAYGPETKFLTTQNFSVHQTKSGYLWIGTQNGLVRFDGKQYKNYFADYSNPNSPTDNTIADIVEDKNGELWFCGFFYGLTKYNEKTGRFKKYRQPTKDNFQFYGINDGHKDKDGNIWFATAGRGVAKYLYDKDSFALFYPEPDKCTDGSKRGENYVTGICEDKNDSDILWVTTYVGFYSFNKKIKAFTYYHSGIKVPYATDINFTSCNADNAGNIWLGAYDEGLICFNTVTKKFVHQKRKTFPRTISQVTVISDSILFVAALNDGLYQLNVNTGTYSNITPPRNPADPTSKKTSIHKVSVTPNAGTFIGGNNYLYQLHPAFTRLKKNIFYQGMGVTDDISLTDFLWDEARAQYWLSTNFGNGLYTLKPNETVAKKVIVNENPVNGQKIYSQLIKDAKKRLWALNYFSGIYLWNPIKQVFEKPVAASFPFADSVLNKIKSLQTDKFGNIWLLSGDALIYYDVLKNKFENYPLIWDMNYKGPKKFAPAIIRIDPDENAWLLTQNGIFVCNKKQKKVKHIYITGTTPNSLPSLSMEAGAFNKYNNLWLSTGNGIQVYDWQKQTVLTTHTIKQGLPSMIVKDIQTDSSGRIWANTLAGLALFDPQKKVWRNYNRFDGFESDYLDGSLFVTTNNKIVIDQRSGLVLKDINEMGSSANAPILRFTSIRINDKEFIDSVAPEFCSQLNLPHHQNNISLEFGAMDWLYPFKTNYLYKIDGLPIPNTFIPITDNKINLTSLAPGKYIIHVKAISGSGVWSNEIIFTININKPFWQTAAFIILCIALVAALFYSLYRYRINQLKKVQAIRNNISRNLHDDIGASLSNINILTELAKRNKNNPGKATEYLDKAGEDIQYISQNLSDIVWNINPGYDNAESLFIRMKRYAADMFDGKDIEYTLDFPEDAGQLKLTMERRRNLYLFFKEAVNNLAKYSTAGNASITLQILPAQLRLAIKDDGIGFNVDTIEKGNGLHNMQQRADSLKGQLKITSAPEQGTHINLTIPL